MKYLRAFGLNSLIRPTALAFVALALLGCSGAAEVPDEEKGPPPPVSASSLCILNVDCPSGQHCDLGECVQSCNTENPCNGRLECSPRARCLQAGEEDTEPAPAQRQRGVLGVAPQSVQILEDASEFKLTLSSTAPERIEYRVTSLSKFLSIAEPRGGFRDATVLTFSVDPSQIEDTDAGGSIKIFSSLGEVVVPVVLKKGISGKYQGALRYTSNGIEMGDARVAVEMLGSNGDLDVVFDPHTSLLFPDSGAGPTTGFGTYVDEEGARFTVLQRIAPSFGGARNHFQRALGRRLTVEMTRTALGGFEGTFEETIYGLFERPVKLEGTIFLSPRMGEGRPDFELSPDVQMPAIVVPPIAELNAGFFGTNPPSTCSSVLTVVSPGGWNANWSDVRFYNRLPNLMATRTDPGSAKTYADVLDICAREIHSVAPANVQCAWHPALICAANYASGAFGSGNDSDKNPAAFQEFFVAALNPPLLMAQEYSVKALDDSLGLGGLGKERGAYDKASQALAPVSKWALHPQIIAYLNLLPVDVAQGNEPGEGQDSTSGQTFPAARALARLFQVSASIDGERSRVDSVQALASDTAAITAAQARGVIGLLEAAVLVELTRTWGITPDMVAADLSGFLNPIDNGFGALVEGARAFGVPDGYIPFVWRPEDAGGAASNFEQMLALANKSQAATASLEGAYVQNKRAFEESESQLLQEVLNISLTYDSQIKDICGNDFDVAAVKSAKDWQSCGAGNKGDVGSALLSIQQADQRIAEQMSRIEGMRDKLEIDQTALDQTQAARGKTLKFLDVSGRQIAGLQMTIDSINLAQQVISLASQSSMMNFGGPAVGATAVALLGVAELSAKTAQGFLRQAHEMALPRLDGQLELINGMANLQRQTIDVQQALLEVTSYCMEKVQTQIQTNNLVSRAKRLHALRTQAQSIAALNPSYDPSFRLLRDGLALQLLDSRARTQRMLFLAGRALEYEVNTPLDSLGSAVLSARSSLGMEQFGACLTDIHSSYRIAFGNPQTYTTEVSVRQMLGISGPRTDEVTGEELSPGRQFRLITQKNQNFDAAGALTITFATELQPDNGLWSTDVCGDRISTVQAQLVGDNLGDNEAQVNLDLTGAAVLRACDSDSFHVWSMSSGTTAGNARAIVQAGVNSYGTTEPNNSLFGQSVARASWKITIPPGSVAPTNSDLDLSQLEDIVLKIEHKASPRTSTPLNVDLSCLSSIN